MIIDNPEVEILLPVHNEGGSIRIAMCEPIDSERKECPRAVRDGMQALSAPFLPWNSQIRFTNPG